MIRVGVLMGGKSVEREVSFNTGRTVCDHLDTLCYQVVPLFQTWSGTLYVLPWHFLHRGKISDFEHRLSSQAEIVAWDDLPNTVDFVYIALHGRNGEDGTIQGALELLGVPYLGSGILTSAVCMDKSVQKIFLHAGGIAVPKSVVFSPEAIAAFTTHDTVCQLLTQASITLPCVVKPHHEGSSLGVQIVTTTDQLLSALHTASGVYPYKKQAVVVEEHLEGMEFSCIVLTDYKTNTLTALPPTEIVPEPGTCFFDYEQKYMPGRATKYTPPRCSNKLTVAIQATCKRVMDILGITNFGRIDGFVTPDGRIVIVDPNTLSGMSPASFLFREAAAAELNMSHAQLINHLIETELSAYGIADKQLQGNSVNNTVSRTRVAVLMGGNSNEREISFESGRNVTYKLSPQQYEAVPIFVSSAMKLYRMDQSLLVRNSTREVELMLDSYRAITWQELPQLADFVFIALHGGFGENGAVQGMLELLGLPYNGSSVLTSALCMDKYKTNAFLKAHGFDVPRNVLISAAAWQMQAAELNETIAPTLGFPLIVKPHDDGCSVLVHKVHTAAALHDAITALINAGKSQVLVEEYIVGMELTIGVIGNHTPRALPPTHAVSAHGVLSIQEKFLPGAGENQTPAPLPDDTLAWIQATVERAYTALQCKGYARIDCFYQSAEQNPTGTQRLVFLEVNTLPGLTPATVIFHQAAEVGMRPMEFIHSIIQLGLEEHATNTSRQHLVTDTSVSATV